MPERKPLSRNTLRREVPAIRREQRRIERDFIDDFSEGLGLPTPDVSHARERELSQHPDNRRPQ
jgi:hypothetical protein